MLSPLLACLLAAVEPADPISEWARFESMVRDQTIRKAGAEKQLGILYAALKDLCGNYPFQPQTSWHFPVQGYGVKDLGAGGFRSRGYDFYDGNRHGGHPAYDIFIRDRNQDALDDRTLRPVTVLAPVDLLILSAEKHWKPGSAIRGGRYIWALDPAEDRLFYFAHLNDVRTGAGAFHKAGSVIGTIGRTGKNALPARSPTHLHFMVLQVKGTILVPLDYRKHLPSQ